jgi:hypothetical protein
MCAYYRHSDFQFYMCAYRHKTYTRIGQNCIRGMSSTPSPPSHCDFLITSIHYRVLHLIDRCLNLNSCLQPPPHAGLIDFNFGADFGYFGGDFGASFGFDADFGAVFGNFADFFGGSVTSDFEVDSCGSSSDDRSGHRRRQKRRRRRCRPNQLFRVENVKNSCWYRNFTAPGETRDLTHELSSSDRFGEFRHYFRMPLSKVEALMDTLIERGYVRFLWSRCRQAEFREQTELLVMSSLYLLGTGAAFRSC